MPRPPVFAPDATSADVQDYLTLFFMAMDHRITVPQAQKRAREMEIDGERAYNLPYKAWMEAYGLQGQSIYIELREANYRYNRSPILKKLKQWYCSWAAAPAESNSPPPKKKESTHSQSAAGQCSQVSGFSDSPTGRLPSSQARTPQPDSNSKEEKFPQGEYGQQQVEFRRPYHPEID